MSGGKGIWVVDRIEGDTVVLVHTETGRSLEVSRGLIVVNVDEGAVLRVPVTDEDAPDWSLAVLDEELRRRRLAEAQEILDQLKGRDPGGDVVL